MQKKMRHSKFKNTGILFELLTKQITADIIAGKERSEAKDLLFKYFQEGTELNKEWKLYNEILSENIKDENHAERYLSIILDTRKKLNTKLLVKEKFNLIKEIKEKYPIEDLLKSPVRNYRVIASIYKVFEDGISKDVRFDVKEVYQAKNCIVEHIVGLSKAKESEDELINHYKSQSEEIRLLSYKLLIEKMNEKYSSLDESQKIVLKEYICNVANTNSLGNFLKSKIIEIKDALSNLISKIRDKDAEVTKIKIREVINQLEKINPGKIIKDNQVMAVLLSYELLKECKRVLETKPTTS